MAGISQEMGAVSGRDAQVNLGMQALKSAQMPTNATLQLVEATVQSLQQLQDQMLQMQQANGLGSNVQAKA